MYFCRFIRREKEIAETRFEVAQVESLRYRQRVELLERELQELQDSLNAEREKVQVCTYTKLEEELIFISTMLQKFNLMSALSLTDSLSVHSVCLGGYRVCSSLLI